ncbi:hypothetical protein [Sphingomonas crusticola]|uniref:hypothetical protein n=1 Tax=Sphingomonas crusticola TaxID=1697973 RepID=UPI000E235206|nr:hypothetical protein [Sphingomonas crusticola]
MNFVGKRIGLAVMLAAMPSVALAQAPDCLPQPQAAALVTFALPTLVQKLGNRCSEVLAPNAYIVANAVDLADRYRPDSAAAWPQARRAIGVIFQKFLGQPMPPDMNSDAIRMLAEPALGGLLAKQINRDDCFIANEAIQGARAVSGTDLGRLAVLALTVAERKGKGLTEMLKICKLEPRGQ